ncbi:HPr-rel-A system PqqD family peptide chaperone [Sphingobium lignivorans]|uniref:PqqD family protein of HPr-rel-A system n=1 Tax=Sphingobium lignivorans TaxID=2735886 RepID=A0ABR6NC96_9SPHN|nr:HPr-rel-A system PqqD family peptide chaperone [Sphingobium lignivorans]MBB5984897.1 PqqD family protein of HPr-rel-A system [Sphingobium lignivorans]
MIYRAEPPGQILLESLGPIDALFHKRSGATHLVAAPVPQILAALAEGPADIDVLLARLATRFDLEGEAVAVRAALQARLAELAALGLVHGDRPAAG